MSSLKWVSVGLRGLMEASLVAALAYWGAHAGSTTWSRFTLGFAAPFVGFGVWGAIDFRQLGRAAEPVRLFQELVICAAAAFALASAGQLPLSVAFAVLAVISHALVYATGERLLGTPAA